MLEHDAPYHSVEADGRRTADRAASDASRFTKCRLVFLVCAIGTCSWVLYHGSTSSLVSLKAASLQSKHLGTTILNGSAPCEWSTGGDVYTYPFTAYFDPQHAAYGWEVAYRTSPRSLDGRMLRLGKRHDVYDVPYDTPLADTVEVGWAVWLALPTARRDGGPHGKWTSRAFVGTRASTTNTTFCGCQFMEGDARRFHLTEHGRAHLVAPNLHLTEGAPPWYLNMTRREINEKIERTCRPYAERLGCPADNETAYREWAAGDRDWVVMPWVEVYSDLPRV